MKVGYYNYMDRLRSEGRLIFWCSCGVKEIVEKHMPFRMKCHCGAHMIVMDKEDCP